jgi:hypothetical protein
MRLKTQDIAIATDTVAAMIAGAVADGATGDLRVQTRIAVN